MKCTNCRSREPNLSRSKNLCDYCLDRVSNWYYANQERVKKEQRVRNAELKKKRIALGLCVRCGLNSITPPSTRFCQSCTDKNRADSKRRYDSAPKERSKERSREFRQTHGEYLREYGRSYYKLHPEKYVEAPRKRRAIKKAAEGNFTETEWIKLLNGFGGKCLWCGTAENIHRDHVVPISRGGSNYISNIQPLCKSCNLKKMTKIIDFRPFGNIILDWT